MDTATEELYFQKLQELILDEDKIVTVPYLANTLNIAIEESTYLIKKYVDDQRKHKPGELAVTYVICGVLKNGKGRGVLMLQDGNIKTKTDKFDDIFSETVFSLQKNNNIDYNVIALVDKFDLPDIKEDALVGSIVGKNCIKRKLKIKKLPSPPPSSIKGKSSFFILKTEINKDSGNGTAKIDTKSKPSGIVDMFNKATNANTAHTNNIKTTLKPKNSLSGFFIKSSKNGSSNTNSSQTTSSKDFESEESIKSVDLTSFLEVENSEDIQQLTKKEVQVKKQQKNKKRRRDTSEDANTKRRKRIVIRDDSESDDMFENELDDRDIIENSYEESTRIPSPAEKNHLAPKNRQRKIVDKVYEDDEGFIVTKQEFIYETASEDENILEVVKKDDPKPKLLQKTSSMSSENDSSPKGSKGKKGKKNGPPNQPTLMNFFRKK